MPAVDETGEIAMEVAYTGTIPADSFLAGGSVTLTTTDGYDPIAFNWSVTPGGLTNPASYNIETPSFTLVNPVREDVAFAGWTGSNGEIPQTGITVPKGSTGSLSYTAHWCKDFTACTASVPNPTYHDGYYIGYFYDGSWNENHGGIVVKDPEGNELVYNTDYYYAGTESLDYPDLYTDDLCTHVGERCRVTLEGCGDWTGTLTADIIILPPHHEGDGWSFDAGVLNITDPGAMSRQNSFLDYPWYAYSGYTTDIVIGEGITAVPYAAFGGNNNLNPYTNVKTVTLPTTLTDIGECAFAYCGLETINLDYVQIIESQAFNRCGNLNIIVPAMAKSTGGTADTVKDIDEFAFDACGKVTFAIVTGDTEYGTVTAMVDNSAVEAAAVSAAVTLAVMPAEDCELKILTYTPVGGEEQEITSDAETGAYFFTMPRKPVIVNAVFKPVFGTPDFILPADTTTIGKSAFEGDTEMTVVDAHSVTFIDEQAFKDCDELKQIRLPKACDIAPDAFSGRETVYVFAPAGGSTQAYCDLETNPCVFVEEEETTDEED